VKNDLNTPTYITSNGVDVKTNSIDGIRSIMIRTPFAKRKREQLRCIIYYKSKQKSIKMPAPQKRDTGIILVFRAMGEKTLYNADDNSDYDSYIREEK